MNDRAFISLLKLVPKAALSKAVGVATRLPVPSFLHHRAAHVFVKAYGVDLTDAELAIEGYPNFGAFFTRTLKPGTRPIAEGDDVVVSPVDGKIYAAACSTDGRLFQAKGRQYSLAQLLDDNVDGRAFEGGCYTTIYLAPRDYHRIHAPLGGEIEGFTYIPGELWPVNPPSVRCVPNLFAVNERLITFLKTPLGRVAVVKVGATCVGRIRASYEEIVTNAGAPARKVKYDRPIPIKKGDELGVFEMGSTVILLFEPGRVEFDDAVVEDKVVRMGERIGHRAKA